MSFMVSQITNNSSIFSHVVQGEHKNTHNTALGIYRWIPVTKGQQVQFIDASHQN